VTVTYFFRKKDQLQKSGKRIDQEKGAHIKRDQELFFPPDVISATPFFSSFENW
jgi:hypothetical protein